MAAASVAVAVLVAGCGSGNNEMGALSDGVDGARSLLESRDVDAAAAGACQLYAGWQGMSAGMQERMRPTVMGQLDRYRNDDDERVRSVAEAAAAVVDGTVEGNTALADVLRKACGK